MAQPTVKGFGKLLVEIDLAGTGIFTAPCGFTEKSFKIESETTDTTIPDCDDPDAPAWTGRDKSSISWSVSGSGILAMEALPTWRDAAVATVAFKVRVRIVGAEPQAGFYEGNAHLTSFELSGSQGEKQKISVELVGDGEAIWTTEAS